MIDSGMATAEIRVARQSRRKMNTTMTASAAPSSRVLHGGFVVAFDIADGVVDQGVADVRMGLGQLRQFGFDHAGDIDIAGALGAEDR